MTRKEFLSALLVAGGAHSLPARALPLVSGGDGVYEPEREITTLLEPVLKKYALPALASAVYHQGRIVAQGVVGVRKVGDPTVATVTDQFHLGSCTKAMTATLVALLVEAGKLSWNRTLAQAFPDVGAKIHPDLRAVTLDQLLCQRSGISGDSWPQGQTFLSLHQLPGSFREQRNAYAAMILREAPLAPPGSKFIYSNRNFALAGIMAERAAGEAWETLITKRLFVPLGLKTTGFGAMGTPGKVDQPWQHRLENDKPVPIAPGPLSDNPEVIGPAGTVHCSIGDWAQFVGAHVRGESGGSDLLKPETYKRLHTPLFGGDYAFGWIVTERGWGGGKVLTHAGSNNQNYAIVWAAPLRDFAVVVATNVAGGNTPLACDAVAATMIRTFLKS